MSTTNFRCISPVDTDNNDPSDEVFDASEDTDSSRSVSRLSNDSDSWDRDYYALLERHRIMALMFIGMSILAWGLAVNLMLISSGPGASLGGTTSYPVHNLGYGQCAVGNYRLSTHDCFNLLGHYQLRY